MATIQLYQYFVVDVDERSIKGGSLSRAKAITITDNEVYDQTFKVAPETAVKIYDASENDALGGFDFGWLECDLDVLIQSTTGVGVSDAYDVKTLKGSGTAGIMGPAKVFSSDVTQLLDGSIDAFDGTADTIGEIWAYNADSTDTARIRIVLAT
jgi:hypothetical protein